MALALALAVVGFALALAFSFGFAAAAPLGGGPTTGAAWSGANFGCFTCGSSATSMAAGGCRAGGEAGEPETIVASSPRPLEEAAAAAGPPPLAKVWSAVGALGC